ncbi:hypothetical protein ACJX0J_023688 [Zea mays]
MDEFLHLNCIIVTIYFTFNQSNQHVPKILIYVSSNTFFIKKNIYFKRWKSYKLKRREQDLGLLWLWKKLCCRFNLDYFVSYIYCIIVLCHIILIYYSNLTDTMLEFDRSILTSKNLKKNSKNIEIIYKVDFI